MMWVHNAFNIRPYTSSVLVQEYFNTISLLSDTFSLHIIVIAVLTDKGVIFLFNNVLMFHWLE